MLTGSKESPVYLSVVSFVEIHSFVSICRLSTIRNADQIAVISGGEVAEIGSFDDLMEIENGIFKKLVEKQTEEWSDEF